MTAPPVFFLENSQDFQRLFLLVTEWPLSCLSVVPPPPRPRSSPPTGAVGTGGILIQFYGQDAGGVKMSKTWTKGFGLCLPI